ncbi:MAG: sulfotransferase family 2 domain-containing protein [Paracoccaceae bacterium]
MLISVSKRFIFVANTKTASTSIENALLPHGDIIASGTPERRHMPLQKALKSYPYLFNHPDHARQKFFKFGVMRDPIDWIYSWFRYRKGNAVESPLPQDLDFETFWRRQDWNIVRMNGNKHLQLQAFQGRKGNILADLIIPYHRINDIYPDVARLLGVDPGLPQHNVSKLPNDRDFPEDLQDEMRAFYEEDYALWDTLEELNEKGMQKLERRAARRLTKAAP